MPNLEIEIIEVNEIEGGVEIFARAWSNGQQIGFGNNGSVDIERFRIFNPPILVPDPNGEIAIEVGSLELGVPITTERYREDPEEATLQVLERTIAGMANAHLNTTIELGKRGNTTSTFYAGANDGYAFDVETTWAAVRSAAGQGSSYTATILAVQASRETASEWVIYRSPMPFDTSAIPDSDVISAANIYFTPQTADTGGADAQSMCLDKVTTITPATGNYNITNHATVDQATRLAISTMSVNTETNLALNATGISNINKTGTTNFGFRFSFDMDNTTPASVSAVQRIFPYASEQSGTTRDPRLVVEHAAAGAGFIPRIIMY